MSSKNVKRVSFVGQVSFLAILIFIACSIHSANAWLLQGPSKEIAGVSEDDRKNFNNVAQQTVGVLETVISVIASAETNHTEIDRDTLAKHADALELLASEFSKLSDTTFAKAQPRWNNSEAVLEVLERSEDSIVSLNYLSKNVLDGSGISELLAELTWETSQHLWALLKSELSQQNPNDQAGRAALAMVLETSTSIFHLLNAASGALS